MYRGKMRFWSRLGAVGGFLLFIAAPSVGCKRIVHGILGKAEESAGISDDGKGAYTFSNAKDQTSMTLGNQEAPADFPKSIPLYPGAVLTNGDAVRDPTLVVTGVNLQTPDSADQVVAFYKAKYGTSDFKEPNFGTNNPVAVLGRIVTFNDSESDTKVSLTIQSLGAKGTNIIISARKSVK